MIQAIATDAVVFGGAEQYLAILLGSLGSHVDVTVVGQDMAVVEAIAARRPAARTRLVPPARNKRHIRPIVAHIAAVRKMRAIELVQQRHERMEVIGEAVVERQCRVASMLPLGRESGEVVEGDERRAPEHPRRQSLPARGAVPRAAQHRPWPARALRA